MTEKIKNDAKASTEKIILDKLDELLSEVAIIKSKMSTLRNEIRLQSCQNSNLTSWFQTLRR